MDNIIDIIGVSSGYRGSFVLKNINFKVKSGEFIGLIGPNGAGKSTLLKTLAGLIKPFQGEIMLKKFDFQKMDLKEKAKHIAVLPQIFKAQFSYTVEEFIMMGRFPHLEGLGRYCREDIESALKLMEKLGLIGIKHKRINEISGGELQKVLFAQALVQGSEIVLLDEPTAHLDIGHQVEIMGILSGLNRDGLTVISVFHDLNLASEYCGRLIMLDKGEIVKDGSPQEVMDYRTIEQVYNARVVIKENPYSKKPFLILYSAKR